MLHSKKALLTRHWTLHSAHHAPSRIDGAERTERSAHRSACNLGYMEPESDRSSAREHFSYMAAHRPVLAPAPAAAPVPVPAPAPAPVPAPVTENTTRSTAGCSPRFTGNALIVSCLTRRCIRAAALPEYHPRPSALRELRVVLCGLGEGEQVAQEAVALVSRLLGTKLCVWAA